MSGQQRRSHSLHSLGQFRILGQEPVPWMNRVHIVLKTQLNQSWNVQIRLNRLASTTDLIRFVGFEAMQSIAVFVGIYCNCPNTKLGCTAKHANSNFTSIGNKKLFNRFHKRRSLDLICEKVLFFQSTVSKRAAESCSGERRFLQILTVRKILHFDRI